jgi:2-oxo-4-hydroxy-4-carboxy-5-ureidoimidazoline decarboxylase
VSAARLDDLNRGDLAAFVAALGHLFEHSPWVAEETYPRRPFRDARHLHSELCATLRAAGPERQLALIRAHPDLAGRLARAGQLTQASAGEQASAGLDRLEPEEMAELDALNRAYRERFGFPFVICARLNAKDAIFRSLRARLPHAPDEERSAAVAEIEKIAWLRLEDSLKT